eukprot:UN22480
MDPGFGPVWVDSSREMRVPFSGEIIECHICDGKGRTTSTDKDGRTTTTQCGPCRGTGKIHKYKVLCTSFGTRSRCRTLDVSGCPLFLYRTGTGKLLNLKR